MLTQQIHSHQQKTPVQVHVPEPKPKITWALLPNIQWALAPQTQLQYQEQPPYQK